MAERKSLLLRIDQKLWREIEKLPTKICEVSMAKLSSS